MARDANTMMTFVPGAVAPARV